MSKTDPLAKLRAMGVTMSAVEPSTPPRPPKRDAPTPKKVVQAIRALLREQRGLSACSIVWALVPELREFVDGMTAGYLGTFPWDPSDFARCRRVLALIPDGAERIGDVAATYPKVRAWARLAQAWAELEALFVVESTRADKTAPKLYARMGELTR